ncbi:MAG: hypothetical protein ACO20L_01510, partial [Candidatus Puniceispirillaceae bacterium]
MAKPKQPSARPGDMIDGEAVEKPSQTTSQGKAGTKNDTAPSDAVSGAPDSKLLAKPLPMFQAIIFAALG